jgi:hypothetical protein
MFGINPAEHRKCADEENQKEFLTGALSEMIGRRTRALHVNPCMIR